MVLFNFQRLGVSQPGRYFSRGELVNSSRSGAIFSRTNIRLCPATAGNISLRPAKPENHAEMAGRPVFRILSWLPAGYVRGLRDHIRGRCCVDQFGGPENSATVVYIFSADYSHSSARCSGWLTYFSTDPYFFAFCETTISRCDGLHRAAFHDPAVSLRHSGARRRRSCMGDLCQFCFKSSDRSNQSLATGTEQARHDRRRTTISTRGV